MNDKPHDQRKHSKFSASGAYRYFECPGSVALCEQVPSVSSPKAAEGTRAHEALEKIIKKGAVDTSYPSDMVKYARHAADHILSIYGDASKAALLIEAKVSLAFIHPEAFGTLDAAVVETFGTLHILDFKYGLYPVSPRENLQFIFYALGVAHANDWNFKRIKMWTLQPRVKGFDGYTFWEITTEELKLYVSKFQHAIERVEKFPTQYKEGSYCFFCAGRNICPIKTKARIEKAMYVFQPRF